MNALDPALRRILEKTVIEARDVAEASAARAVDRLGVGRAVKPAYLSDDEAALRRRLRQRGRALGDARQADGAQGTDALEREAAYEHWHRLLFARFLLENDLLVYPGTDVVVGMSECEDVAKETARETGERTDAFDVAAGFAAAMLPQIFRTGDAVLEVRFAPEDRAALRRLVTGLSAVTFHADDALGWVYQFWQAKRKDAVNASGVKIGAAELPAVTQLFTEDYMVRFLLENTLGAWWVARHPDAPLPSEMPYLRRLDDGTPAAGGFDGWPDRVADLRVIDPSMGSGHFLVAALAILAPMRQAEEGIDARTAVDRVLAENLHGLELDPRCTQIAAFALALAAWTFPGAAGVRDLPPMRLACSGLAPSGSLAEWTALADAAATTDAERERLGNGMRRLYALFQDAPTLGSLIDPGQVEEPLLTADPADLAPLLAEALGRDEETTDRGVVARGIAEAASLLGQRYHLVATNVPFLTRQRQSTALRDFCESQYSAGQSDLATSMWLRCKSLCFRGGTVATVTPQNWLFLSAYKSFRFIVVSKCNINSIVEIGQNGFESNQAAGALTALSIISNENSDQDNFQAWILASRNSPLGKKEMLISDPAVSVSQNDQIAHTGYIISLVDLGAGVPLDQVASSAGGVGTSDSKRFVQYFWETDVIFPNYEYQQGSVSSIGMFYGRSNVILWEEGVGGLFRLAQSVRHLNHGAQNYRRGQEAWGEKGVLVSRMGDLPCSLYDGHKYDDNVATLIPDNDSDFIPLWLYCSSGIHGEEVRKLDKALKVTSATLLKVNIDIEHWRALAEEQYPDGLPAPESDDPTQWLFHGHPAHAEDPTGKAAAALHVAVARLVGYRWPAETDAEMELSDRARALITDVLALDGHADDDGIVCLPPVARERPAADRLADLLRDAFGDRWTASLQARLLGQEGIPRGTLAEWLRTKFFANHCALFGWRPFVWHVTDGHREGFSALVNVHRLDRAGLEKLLYTYLGDWTARQKVAAAEGEPGADGRLAAAEALARRLTLILDGEPPHDVFVRWKPASEQPIGWAPDLNDGLLVNIWPFLEAGVLNLTPSQAKRFKYGKDRGTNPPGESWGPERWNRYEDILDADKLHDAEGRVIPHLTNAVKQVARDAAG